MPEKKALISTGFHLPYDPDLVEKSRLLRKNMTPAEQKLWRGYLRDFRFRVLRQRPIDHYIVDFYCPQLKLVIEIDGETHYPDEGKRHDEKRTWILEAYGLKIIRFTNREVLENLEGVCETIEKVSCEDSQEDPTFILP